MRYFLLTLFFIFSCNYATGQGAPDLKDSVRMEEIRKIGSRLESISADSANYIINELNKLYSQKGNKSALIYSEYYAAKLSWMSSDHLKAMEWAVKALNHSQQWNIPRLQPSIYAIIGNLYKEKLNYPMAFASAEKGLAAAKNNRDTPNIISITSLKAMFIKTQNLSRQQPQAKDGSQELYFEAMRLAQTNPDKYEKQLAVIYDNIAQQYKDYKDFDKAICYANKAVYIAKKYNLRRSLTYSYNWLGEALYHKGNKEEGLAYLDSALEIALSLKQPYRVFELYSSLADCYYYFGDYKQAFEYQERFYVLRDSLTVMDNEKHMNELQVKYESVKKDQEILNMEETSQIYAGQVKWLALAGGVFLIISIFLLYLYYIIRKKNAFIESKNSQINEQSAKLQVLMQELHHRVKNNLQIVSSLLSLQSSRLTDTDARNVLTVSKQRIDAMSIIHQSLYQHDSANMVKFREYVDNLLNSILQSFGRMADDISITVIIEVPEIDVDVALPLGLILNEWITNVLKHAYCNKPCTPELSIFVSVIGNDLKLVIKDNGVGMPPDLWDNPQASFGIKLMKVLMKQIRATPVIIPENGTTLKLIVPLS